MAEGGKDNKKSSDQNSWWGGWGQGWIDSVKEKSASTLEMVKKDLNEFVEVIQGDTSIAISETASKLEERVENQEKNTAQETDVLNSEDIVKQGVKGISKVLHSLSDLMSVQDPDDSNEEFITLTDDKFSLHSYNRKQEKLHSLQIDPGTYCNEPEGSFSDWLHVFSLDESKEDMSDLLTQNVAVRALYSQLVPNVISHTTFWQRYYYQVFLLEAEERKREDLLARAANVENTKADNNDDEDDGWGDEEDDIEVVSERNITPAKKNTSSFEVSSEIRTSGIASNENKESLQSPKSLRTDLNKTTDGKCLEETDKTLDTEITNDITLEKLKIEPNTTEVISPSNELEKIDIDTPNIASPVELDNEKCEKLPVAASSALLREPSAKHDLSDTTSVSSWLSIDDDIKVKKIKGEQVVKDPAVKQGSEGSSDSSGVLINKSEADDLDDDDDDFEIDLDVDVNEEELAKMVADIKTKSSSSNQQDDDDDDWENWE